jgi:nucleotide-binding universal stress UspA family protein
MKAIKKILCAVDFSEQSKGVAESAVFLAKACGANIVAVYTAPSLNHYMSLHVSDATIENFEEEVANAAEKAMTDFVAEHFAGVEAKGLVVRGNAAEEILKQAKKEQADLIVMGTHGRTGIDRVLFGSVAAKVVKYSTIPVLTVRPSQ